MSLLDACSPPPTCPGAEQQERSESGAALARRMEKAQAERDEAIRRLTKDSECHHEQVNLCGNEDV